MAVKKNVNVCENCHAVAESLWDGAGEISCCQTPMKELVAGTVDAAREKHVPVMERSGDEVRVKVGEVPHPMTSQHYILFIEVLAGDKVYRHDFKPGDTKAEAVFIVPEKEITARAFCNLHGFWESKLRPAV